MSGLPGHHTRLQKRLRFRVGLLVSCAVLVVGAAFSIFGLRPMVERVALSQFSLATERVKASLDRVFDPAEQYLLMCSEWLAAADLNSKSPLAFNRLFHPLLETLPQVTSVVAGTDSGDGWMLLQEAEGKWLNRLTDVQRMGDLHSFFEWQADGAFREYKQMLDYDPRKRAWYLNAVKDKTSVQWTAPYVFMTTRDPGVTASKHVGMKGGGEFVVGLDLKLRDLSLTTMKAQMGGAEKLWC